MMRSIPVVVFVLSLWWLPAYSQPSTCPAGIDEILTSADSICSGLGRNEVCYGNRLIESELMEYNPFVFATTGDIVAVNDLISLRTTPLSLDDETWGIAIFDIQADLDNTLPGQSVTMVVFGDTELTPNPDAPEDYDQPMQAFTFETGIGFPACKAVPHGGILIQNPSGSSIHLQVNGFDLEVSSTALLTAQTEQDLTITTLEGNVQVTTDGIQQDVSAGFTLTVTQDAPPELPNAAPDVEVELAKLLPEELPQIGEPTQESIGLLRCANSGGMDVSVGSTLTMRGGWGEEDMLTLTTAVLGLSPTLDFDGERLAMSYRSGPGPWGDGFAVNWYWIVDVVEAGTHQAVWSIGGETFSCEIRAG